MADPSSAALPSPTGSSGDEPVAVASSRLGGVLAGRDLDGFQPTAEQAREVMAEVAAYCRDYCPARLHCVEDACRLYRLEGRAHDAIAPSPSERVGVIGQSIIGL